MHCEKTKLSEQKGLLGTERAENAIYVAEVQFLVAEKAAASRQKRFFEDTKLVKILPRSKLCGVTKLHIHAKTGGHVIAQDLSLL